MPPRDIFVPINILHELLRYDSESGHLYWKTNLGRCQSSRPAGHLAKNGYWVIRINNTLYKSHRVIFAMVHKRWPKLYVDHVDGNRSNNRVCNLREATRSQNMHNVKLRCDNKTGVKGIAWEADRNKYVAYVSIRGCIKFKKRFSSLESAISARRKAAKKLHGEFVRHK